jgi:hypothetical protein
MISEQSLAKTAAIALYLDLTTLAKTAAIAL